MRHALMFAALCMLAAPLAADFEADVEASVVAPGTARLETATLTFEADPLWGNYNERDFEAYKKANGPLPEVIFTGEGKVDARGAFKFKVKVSTKGEGKIPVVQVRQGRGTAPIDYQIVYAVAVIRCEGCRTHRMKIQVSDKGGCKFSTGLRALSTLHGRAISVSDRKGVANLKIGFVRSYGDSPMAVLGTATTDAEGRFTAEDEQVPTESFGVRVLEGDWQFALASKAFQHSHAQTGKNDLGDLVVQPAGYFKAAATFDNGKAANVDWIIGEAGSNSRYMVRGTVADGQIDSGLLPIGTYFLRLSNPNCVTYLNESIKVEGGKSLDLGTIALKPYRSLELVVKDDAGANVKLANLTGTKLVDGKVPTDARSERAGGAVRDGAGRMDRLTDGTWQLEITSQNLLPKTIEVVIPADKPLVVTLTRGGEISVTCTETSGAAVGWFTCFAAPKGSAGETYLNEHFESGINDWESRQNGVYSARGGDAQPAVFKALEPGTWIVAVSVHDGGKQRNNAVEVKAGQAAAVAFTVKPGTLTIAVTQEGKPRPETPLFLYVVEDRREFTVVEAKTDAQGKHVFERAKPTSVFVLLAHQHEWMLAVLAKDSYVQEQRLRQLADQSELVGSGEAKELAIEWHDPKRIMLRVKTILPDGYSIRHLSLFPVAVNAGKPGTSATPENGLATFPLVEAGQYRLHALIRSTGAEELPFTRVVDVKTAPVQDFDLTIKIDGLAVKLSLPAGTDSRRVALGVQPADTTPDTPREQMDWSRIKSAVVNADGTAFFAMLPDGEYRLWAHVRGADGMVAHAASTNVLVEGGGEATLAFIEDAGTVSIRVVGNPTTDRGMRQDHGLAVEVQFMDKSGTKVVIGDPFLASGLAQAGNSFRVPSVPVGEYEVLVAARGLQPERVSVVVTKGETTNAVVTPLAAALLRVSLPGMTPDRLSKAELRIGFEDTKGGKMPLLCPGAVATLWQGPDGTYQLSVHNLYAGVGQVRLIMKGYEDTVFTVKVEPGHVQAATLTLKPKAD